MAKDTDEAETKTLIEDAAKVLAPRLEALSLMSDYMFTAFMQDNISCMQTVLRAFTGDHIIMVTRVTTQYVVENGAEGRGVRYDSRVETADGTVYNLEVENKPDGALELRLRYYSEMLDKENLKLGESYKDLPPVVNIVIMPKDIGGQGRPLYFVRRVFVKSLTQIGKFPKFFNDKMAFIYVNATYKNTKKLVGKVIHDFTTPSGEPKLVREIEESMRKFINTEEGRKEMSTKLAEQGLAVGRLSHLLSDSEREAAVREGREEGLAEGRAEGLRDGRIEGEVGLLQQLANLGLVHRENLVDIYAGREIPKIVFPD